MSDIIVEGNYVVLMKNFDIENMKIIHVIKNSIVHYGKLHFDPTSLINASFGSVFQIQGKEMIEVKDFERFDRDVSTAVTENMLTFSEKSDFSKEKIIKKKKKKSWANVVTLVKPSIILINELLYARDKLGGLRCDSLSQILTQSNVQNGSKCILLDHNLGLLSGAVMSRILPDGVCIQVFPDIEACYTTRKTLEMLNITQEQSANKILAITLRDLYKVYKNQDTFEYDNQVMKAKSEEQVEKSMTHIENNKRKLDESLYAVKKDTNRELRNAERIQAASHLKTKSLDSLIIIAQNDHPLPILKILYHFLAPSRQIVIYSDTIEPVLECYHHLKSNQLAVTLNLSETWLRRYQVLPDRSRPEMNMSGFGGYLLSGTKAHLLSLPA